MTPFTVAVPWKVANVPLMTIQSIVVDLIVSLVSLTFNSMLPFGRLFASNFTLNPKLAFTPVRGTPFEPDEVNTQPPPVTKVDGSNTATSADAIVALQKPVA